VVSGETSLWHGPSFYSYLYVLFYLFVQVIRDVSIKMCQEAHERNLQSFFTDPKSKAWAIPVTRNADKTSQEHFKGRLEATRTWVRSFRAFALFDVVTETVMPSP